MVKRRRSSKEKTRPPKSSPAPRPDGSGLSARKDMKKKAVPPPLLRLENLVKERRQEHGFRLLVPHLEIRPGERIALLGKSGSGKSTLLDMLALILRPGQADAFTLTPPGGDTADLLEAWNDADVLSRLRLNNMGYVLQTGGLLPFLSVRDNILLSCRVRGGPDNLERLENLAERLSISRLLNKLPGRISLGERQRVSIARALIHEPVLVIADEPTAALDPITGAEVFDLLLELAADTALIAATHDWNRARDSHFRVLNLALEQDGNGNVTATVEE